MHLEQSAVLGAGLVIIEELVSMDKTIYIMGHLLKCEKYQVTQSFLLWLQSCYIFPTIDYPTHVHNNSATFMNNIFINNFLACGNIMSDISDHFSQFFIAKDAKDRTARGNNAIARDSGADPAIFVTDVQLAQASRGVRGHAKILKSGPRKCDFLRFQSNS